jgi:serine/threonine protein kinase
MNIISIYVLFIFLVSSNLSAAKSDVKCSTPVRFITYSFELVLPSGQKTVDLETFCRRVNPISFQSNTVVSIGGTDFSVSRFEDKLSYLLMPLDRDISRAYAVKLLKRNIFLEEYWLPYKKVFHNEARVLRYSHEKNITRSERLIAEHTEDEDTIWLQMKYIPGTNFERIGKIISESDLSAVKELVRIISIKAYLRLLEYHQAGIYIGDVKPSNIIYDPRSDAVEFLDFGGAYIKGRDDNLPYGLYTNGFIPPELDSLDKIRYPHPTEEGDLWSLGSTIEFMIDRAKYRADDVPLSSLVTGLKQRAPSARLRKSNEWRGEHRRLIQIVAN